MPENLTPQQVIERLLDGLVNRDWDALAGLYAPDVVVDIPFASPEGRRMEGRQALAEHFAAAAQRPLTLKLGNAVFHRTADPEVVVAEFDYEGVVTTTGRTFRVPNVIVARIRNGQIVHSRDYHNHLVFAQAMDQLPELVAVFSAA